MSSLNILARQKGNGGYIVTFIFLGHKWLLQTNGSQQTWMVRHEDAVVMTPLFNYPEFKRFGAHRRMTLGDDSVVAALESAKAQIMCLKYGKLTPTFHEQHLHYFSSTHGVEAVD